MNLGRESHPALELLDPIAADAELHSAAQLHPVVAARVPQQRLDLVQPHDGRAMNAKELRRVQPLLEHLHALADDVRAPARMQLRVGPAGGDVLDVFRPARPAPARASPRRCARGSPASRPAAGAAGCRLCPPPPWSTASSCSGEPVDFLQLDEPPRARERLLEALVVEGLHEVVDGGEVEGLERVLVVRGDEHRGRHVVGADGADDVEPRHAGHLHIEEHEVGLQRADGVDRGFAVVRRADDLDVLLVPQQVFERWRASASSSTSSTRNGLPRGHGQRASSAVGCDVRWCAGRVRL